MNLSPNLGEICFRQNTLKFNGTNSSKFGYIKKNRELPKT